jgi:xanthine dehydrogenase molybdopterin-binding subunit B
MLKQFHLKQKTPGVVAVLTSKDIPGKNSFIPSTIPWEIMEEELLASKNILYYGQPVALVAATTQTLALSAADLVKVYYKKSNVKPVLSIQDALVAPDKDKRVSFLSIQLQKITCDELKILLQI